RPAFHSAGPFGLCGRCADGHISMDEDSADDNSFSAIAHQSQDTKNRRAADLAVHVAWNHFLYPGDYRFPRCAVRRGRYVDVGGNWSPTGALRDHPGDTRLRKCHQVSDGQHALVEAAGLVSRTVHSGILFTLSCVCQFRTVLGVQEAETFAVVSD